MIQNQFITRFTRLTLLMLIILSCSIFQAPGTPLPPGKISGKVIYQDLKDGGNPESLGGVLVALCRISKEGPPQGPLVAKDAQGQPICTLQGSPTALSGADGTFILDGVPPATYLVLFHLWPDELDTQPVKWDGVVLTDAYLNEVEMVVPPLKDSDFWETGGSVVGTMNWSIEVGGRISQGNVCSNKYGFCFSVRDELLDPVINVESEAMAEVELVARLKPTGQYATPEAANLPPTSTKPAPTRTPTSRPPTATSTPTLTPIPGVDEPIVIEDVLVKNSLGLTELVDISMKVLDAFTQENLKAGEDPIQPKQPGDVFLSLKLDFEGSTNAIDWAATNVEVLCGNATYKATNMGIEFSAGLLASWHLHYQVPSEADVGACSLQLPDGREIPLGRFFSSTSLASTPVSEQNPPPVAPTATQEPGRVYETDGGFSYIPPKGWEVKEVPDFDFQVAHGGQVGGFVPNLYFFVNPSHSGSLDEYVTENLAHSSTILSDLAIISQADFLTDTGERGVKVIIESTQRNMRLRQIEYFFDDGVHNFVATYTRLADKGQNNDALVDQSMKTFRPDIIPGGVPSSPPPAGQPEQIEDDFGIPMVLIPAGTFKMGSEDGNEDERPVHEVTLDAFYIDIYEVTNARYAECVTAGACDPPMGNNSWTRDGYFSNPVFANYPVISVTWFMARSYCEWRGARLPTEAEWEKAARGGIDGASYPWGDEQPVCTKGVENGTNFYGCNNEDTMPVGSFRPNGFGLFDMTGNVWEWVSSLYKRYPYQSGDGREALSANGLRVLRGGGWDNAVFYQRITYRDKFPPDNHNVVCGFRCALGVQPAK